MDVRIEPDMIGDSRGLGVSREADVIRGLQRRLWIERVLFLAVLAAVLYAWLNPLLFPKVWAVWVDGQPVVAMRDRAALQAVAKEVGAQYTSSPAHTEVAQAIRIRPVRPERVPITDVETAREKLSVAWAARVPRAVIYIDGVSAVALADKTQANEVLERVKAHFTEKMTQLSSVPVFKEVVEVREEAAAQDILADVDTAAALLLGESGDKTHTVIPGETGWTVARKYDLSLSALKQLNRSVNLDRLQVGQELQVAEDAGPVVTVVAEGEVTQDVAIAPPSEIRTSPKMYLGKRIVKQPGTPGKERVTMRVRSENGVIVEKQVLSRQKVVAPKSKVVVLGIKPRPSLGRRR